MSEHNGAEWLTVSQAAVRLGISERQARRYAAKLAPDDRRDGGRLSSSESGSSRTFVRLVAMIEARDRVIGSQSNSKVVDTTPDIRPAEAGHDAGHKTGSEPSRATDSRLSRVEGYVARDLELMIGQAVEQAVNNAVGPLLERVESQAAAQALLMAELKELRKDRTVLKEELAKLVEAEQSSPEATKTAIVEALDKAVVPYMGQVEAVWTEVDRVNEENARLKIELEVKRNPWWKFWRGLKVI